jgi:hypothetical protein
MSTNPAWTPLGKKVDLGREVQGTLAAGSGVVLNGYNLGTSSDGLVVLQGLDTTSQLAFYRLQAGQGVTISQSSDGNALVITSSLLASGTPGVMLQSVYDPSASGIVAKAASVPWTGISGLPLTFPPTVPIPESSVTNLVSDLASKTPTTRMINTGSSVQGGGALSADLTISLVGDVAAPGPDMRYGTDVNGIHGWFAASVGAGDMTQAVYDPDKDGIVEEADTVAAGGVNTAAIIDANVTAGKLAAGAALTNLGYTPVNKVGDTMSGQLAISMVGANLGPAMYQNAHLLVETTSGYPTIGFGTSGGGAAISYLSGHQDLNLYYADGTAAALLSSISNINGAQLIDGTVTSSELSAGAAQANLGYRPVNWNGDQMTNTNVFAWQREWGLGAASWEGSPIRLQCATSGARPQIAFWHLGLGYAAALYLETDQSMRTIDAGGTVRVLLDHLNSPHAYGLNYAPVNRAGDQMTGGLYAVGAQNFVSAYQDANNYATLQSAHGLYVRGPYYTGWGTGQVVISSTSNASGFTFNTSNGYSFTLFGYQDGHVYLARNNDKHQVQLL